MSFKKIRKPNARCATPQIETFEPHVRNISQQFSSSGTPPAPSPPVQPSIEEPDKPKKCNETNNISNIPMSTIIKKKSDWASNELNVIRVIYHYVNNKYWTLSIIVIILSSILTIVESIKLIFIDTSNKYLDTDNSNTLENYDNRILYSISKYSLNWNLACDILSLLTGTLITLIMSLIRFNKYQMKLEFISNRLMQLTTYKSNIILMQYKVDNIDYNIKEIKAEFLKMEENIYKDSELDKIISENKEAEFRRNVENLKKRGPHRNYLIYVLSKFLCCRFRISNLKKYDNATTQTDTTDTTDTTETNQINVQLSDYV